MNLRTLLCAALLLTLPAACSDDSSSPCPPCGSGYVCNAATGACIPAASVCDPPCGPNTICAADNTCSCVGGLLDCNGDIGKAGGDGCECDSVCDGTSCRINPPQCKPNVVNDCGEATKFCDAASSACTACPSGKFNCDGTGDCEADVACGAGGCAIYGADSCPTQDQYCDAADETCKPCAAGTLNCNRGGGDCECTTTCDGNSCEKECTSTSGCDTSSYCDLGACKPCPAGRTNCDGKGACECEGTCDGIACQGNRLCDYYDQDVCGGVDTKWCYKNACQDCSSGRFNCNGTMGCECDSAGCNGDQCAGNCSGGECP